MMLYKCVFTIKWDYKLKKVTTTVEEANFHVITSHEITSQGCSASMSHT